MDDTVGEPGDDVENRMGKPCENVGYIGAIKDRLESRQKGYRDGRSPVGWGEPVGVECQEPRKDRSCWDKELARKWDKQCQGV